MYTSLTRIGILLFSCLLMPLTAMGYHGALDGLEILFFNLYIAIIAIPTLFLVWANVKAIADEPWGTTPATVLSFLLLVVNFFILSVFEDSTITLSFLSIFFLGSAVHMAYRSTTTKTEHTKE